MSITLTASANRGHRVPVRGFTLVEILVVVVIIGILAAIVIPQFVSATEESRNNAIKMDLNRIRIQLEVYRQQHNGEWPELAAFEEQMTLSSDTDGQTAAVGTPGYRYGPYLREIPVNPKTDKSSIADTAVGTSSWYYDEDTGEFYANDSELTREF